MSAAGFDTLKLARKLKAAGLPIEQAEAQAEVLGEAFLYNLDQLVSRDYLDARLADLNSRLCSRMDARFAEVDARFVELESHISAKIDARFKAADEQFVEIKGHFRLVHWMLALIIAVNVLPGLARFIGQ